MSSFTFKPQQQVTLWDPSIKHVLWTEERDTIPAALEGRVDLKTWQGTFDAVMDLYKSRYNGVNFTLHLPVVNVVTFPYLLGSRVVYENRWRKLVQEQAEIYGAKDVKVALVQEPSCHKRIITVGLKFEHMSESEVPVYKASAFEEADAKVVVPQ